MSRGSLDFWARIEARLDFISKTSLLLHRIVVGIAKRGSLRHGDAQFVIPAMNLNPRGAVLSFPTAQSKKTRD